MVQRKTMKRFKVAVASLVRQGAEPKSDFMLFQSAVDGDEGIPVPEAGREQVVAAMDELAARLREHLSDGSAVEQGDVSLELNEVRARAGGWDVWYAFQEALADCTSTADVLTAVDELAALLKAELTAPGDADGDEPAGMTVDPSVYQGAPETPETPEAEPEATNTPAETPEAVTEAVSAAPEAAEAEPVAQDAAETAETEAGDTAPAGTEASEDDSEAGDAAEAGMLPPGDLDDPLPGAAASDAPVAQAAQAPNETVALLQGINTALATITERLTALETAKPAVAAPRSAQRDADPAPVRQAAQENFWAGTPLDLLRAR